MDDTVHRSAMNGYFQVQYVNVNSRSERGRSYCIYEVDGSDPVHMSRSRALTCWLGGSIAHQWTQCHDRSNLGIVCLLL